MHASQKNRVLGRLASKWVTFGLAGHLLMFGPASLSAGTATEKPSASSISGNALAENGAGLQGVVITLESFTGSTGAGSIRHPAEAEGTSVINQGGHFTPDLLVVTVGTPVRFRSSDGLFHTAELSDAGRLLTHLALPADGQRFEYTFTEPGVISVKDWMNPQRDVAYIVVAENHYFDVSNGQGRFAISGIPAGTYTLRAWHKDLGSRTFTFAVRLIDAREARVKLVLQEPKLVSMQAESPMPVATGEGLH
jgi:plastocyanin